MLKAGIKRRRTQQQIKDQKAEEEVRQQAIEEKLAKFEKLQQDYEQVKQEAQTNEQARNILANMIDSGQAQVDQNGNVQVIPQSAPQSEMSQNSQQHQMEEPIENSSQFQI